MPLSASGRRRSVRKWSTPLWGQRSQSVVCGIFSGMFSPDDADQVLAALGDKFLQNLVAAVDHTRDDLEAMRVWRPGWFPTMSDRCLANLIHDRLWAHMLSLGDDQSGVTMHESGATREIVIGQFRLRLKRHQFDGRVSNYPTQTAIEFWIQQNDGVLPGMEEITLAAGYRWHKDTKSIGVAVVSYRDGQENMIWAMELRGATSGETVTPITWAPVDTPDLPTIEITGIGEEDEADAGTEGEEGEQDAR